MSTGAVIFVFAIFILATIGAAAVFVAIVITLQELCAKWEQKHKKGGDDYEIR